MIVAGAAEDMRHRREQYQTDTSRPFKGSNPVGEIALAVQEKCQLGLPEWHSWLDNWPELKKIQEAWHEAYPPTKERTCARPQDAVPKHL